MLGKYLIAAALLASPLSLLADFHEWAKTPPMGWNSFDCFGTTVTEDIAKR